MPPRLIGISLREISLIGVKLREVNLMEIILMEVPSFTPSALPPTNLPL
jgi:hypothetical protein